MKGSLYQAYIGIELLYIVASVSSRPNPSTERIRSLAPPIAKTRLFRLRNLVNTNWQACDYHLYGNVMTVFPVLNVHLRRNSVSVPGQTPAPSASASSNSLSLYAQVCFSEFHQLSLKIDLRLVLKI